MADIDVGPDPHGFAGTSVSGAVLDLVDEDVIAAEELPEAAKTIQGRSPWKLAFERLRHDRAAVISAVVIVLMVLFAILAGLVAHITGHPPDAQYHHLGLNEEDFPTGWGKNGFLLGADDLGRDVLVRTAYGARMSLLIGVVATAITVTFGAMMGLMAGYLGRIADTIITRIIDVTLSIPFLLFALALASVWHPGVEIVVVVLVLFSWSSVARIVRGQVLSIREREYVEAARSLGAGSFRIMIVDILPNVMAQVIVYASLLIPLTIVSEATLSFLGVGVQPPTPDWGQMIAESQASGVYQFAPWFLIVPSVALLITTLAFNIFGDGVRDAFDPRADRLFQ